MTQPGLHSSNAAKFINMIAHFYTAQSIIEMAFSNSIFFNNVMKQIHFFERFILTPSKVKPALAIRQMPASSQQSVL